MLARLYGRTESQSQRHMRFGVLSVPVASLPLRQFTSSKGRIQSGAKSLHSATACLPRTNNAREGDVAIALRFLAPPANSAAAVVPDWDQTRESTSPCNTTRFQAPACIQESLRHSPDFDVRGSTKMSGRGKGTSRKAPGACTPQCAQALAVRTHDNALLSSIWASFNRLYPGHVA